MFEPDAQNYYEVLDVKPEASQNEIRQSYLRAKAAYGKDSAALYSLFDERETRQVLENIEQAYLVLSNPEKRKEYDKVHGFMAGSDNLPPSAKQGSSSRAVFSFTSGGVSSSSQDRQEDPAKAAARNVFGADISDGESTETEHSPPSTAKRPAPHVEDYSTPRTLAAATSSHSSAGSDYSSPSSFSSRENRLGIIRRTDLVKPYQKRADMEEEIAKETEFRGDFFRRVREYKEITVDEMSEFTKISKTYINCVEAEEFEGLPAPAYLRGFILQIARALKIPHDKAAAGYMTHYKAAVLK